MVDDSVYRPSYAVAHNKDEDYQRIRLLADAGVWNIDSIPNSQILPGSGALILPFADEPGSALQVATAWRDMYPHLEIFPISAGNERTESELRRASFPVYPQELVLKAIKWEQLIQKGIIPPSALDPEGTKKGLTMLSGALIALRKKNAKSILFHDSDVVNPLQYRALEALPKLLFGSPEYHACMMSLVGPERNNWPWTTHANVVVLLEKMYGENVRKIARRITTLGWGLSGERGYALPWLEELPWTCGMGIETAINVACCQKEEMDGCNYIQQISSPTTKDERQISAFPRERALITSCTGYMGYLLAFLQLNPGAALWGLNLKDAAQINFEYAGKNEDILFQPPTFGAQCLERIRKETTLPCIRKMDEAGLIDWKVIDHIIYSTM